MLLWAFVCLAMNSSVLTYHLSLRPEKEIILAFLLLAHIYKSVIYDMSAALKLAQNYEEQKEQQGWGGEVRRWEEKTAKTHKQNGIKFPALYPAMGSGSYKWDKECI